jgi:DNA-nicking Smr family endonuclease
MANKDKDDLHLFRKHFGDIRRIESDRVEPSHKPSTANVRRNRPLDDDKLDPFQPTRQSSDTESPDAFCYRAQGIQTRQFRRLQRGQLPIEGRLDLHGLTRPQALEKLRAFIASAQKRGIRQVLIIHGKGYQSEGGEAILKPAVAAWLRKIRAAMAFCPAQAADGGDGALYVLLKKR